MSYLPIFCKQGLNMGSCLSEITMIYSFELKRKIWNLIDLQKPERNLKLAYTFHLERGNKSLQGNQTLQCILSFSFLSF